MKTLLKSFFTASLLLAATAVPAQKGGVVQNIEDWMHSNISRVIDAKVEVTKSLGQERDIQQQGAPLKWRCDIYSFTLPKKQRALLDEMVKAFEANGHDNPHCYSINSMSEAPAGDRQGHARNLMIGEDPDRYVTIGKDYTDFLNINLLDAAATTQTHRYAYALEWRMAPKEAVDVRYIITYARIPSATNSITQQNWPYIDLGRSRIRKNGPVQAQGNARLWWLGTDHALQTADSIMREAKRKLKDEEARFEKAKRSITLSHTRKVSQPKFQADDSVVAWTDTLEHEYDPVTDVIDRLHQGLLVTSQDLLCNENILLVFSQLKQQFLAGQNTEFNAISIYTLCKRAREYGFFTDPNAKAELEHLKRELVQMKSATSNETLQSYLQMALTQLQMIE